MLRCSEWMQAERETNLSKRSDVGSSDNKVAGKISYRNNKDSAILSFLHYSDRIVEAI